MNTTDNYTVYNDPMEYINSLYKVNDDGTHKFIGDNQDIRLLVKECYTTDNNISHKVIRINNDWYRVDVHRKFTYMNDWKIDDYEMMEGDKLYQDWEGNVLNFSNRFIYFIRVNNMNDVDETLCLPKEFEHESILGLFDTDKQKNEQLLHYAWLYNSMFIDEKEVIEEFMTATYGEDWNEYSLDEYYKEKHNDYLESLMIGYEE